MRLTVLLACCGGLWCSASTIAAIQWGVIGAILTFVLIGLGLLGCRHYGTNR